MSKRIFDDFDSYADDYRDIHSKNVEVSGVDSFYFAEMKVKLLQPFEKEPAIMLLDIGCGDGATEAYIQEYFPLWKVQAIDVSARSIAVAQERNLKNTHFSLYDGYNIPVEEKKIDVIFIAGVLHHVAFKWHTALVREMYRVLKPGGRIYLFEHNPLNPLTRYLVNTCVFDKDAQLLPAGYSKRLFTQNKFIVGHRKFIIFFPRKGWFLKFISLEKHLGWLPLGGQYMYQFKKD